MIRSMTGYGQGCAELPGLRITVELRSVNNRFTDLRFRLPPDLGALEAEIRRRVLARVRRGRVELTLKAESLPRQDEARPALNRKMLEEVLEASAELQKQHRLPGVLDLSTVLRLPGMLKTETEEPAFDEAGREAVRRALDDGLRALDEDRLREGSELRDDLLERIGAMKQLAAEIRQLAATLPATLRDRLVERLKTLGGEVALDPQRIAQEATLQAERCDATEELVRLDGHLQQAAELLARPDGEPVGRRLEFLVQELQREASTLSAKSPDLELTRRALALKAEIEKMREQSQNLE